MFSDWTSADYFSNIASLVLFAVAYWLGKRQGQIIEDVSKLTTATHRVQEAVATLQFREKMGVMKQGDCAGNMLKPWTSLLLTYATSLARTEIKS